MIFDFSFILTVATLITGIIWGLDAWLWKPARVERAAAAGTAPENVREPIVVEYARSFFPIILIVLFTVLMIWMRKRNATTSANAGVPASETIR